MGKLLASATTEAAIGLLFRGASPAFKRAARNHQLHNYRDTTSIPGIEIFGPPTGDSDERAPTVSFRHRAVPPSHIAKRLGERNIFVWSGHNYALETVRQLKLPEDEGVVRVGAVHYNTTQEIAEAVEAIEAATNC